MLIPGDPEQVNGLRRGIAFGILGQQFFECGNRFSELLAVERGLADTQHEHRDQIFRRKKANRPVVFFPVGIQDDEGRGPLKVELFRQRRIGSHLEGNKVLSDEFDHFGVGVRNRTQLLAANSMGVEKI